MALLWLPSAKAAEAAPPAAPTPAPAEAAGAAAREPGPDAGAAAKSERRALSVKRGSPEAASPFWKSRPEARRRIREERAALFSVNKKTLKDGRRLFSVRGAGIADVPKDFAFRTSQEYDRLPQVSSRFREAKWDAKTKTLFLVAEALGYQARLILAVEPVAEPWRSELQWKAIWGPFEGMSGVVGFEEAGPERCEISVDAELVSEKLPLPKALMGLALEAVAQKVAERMRAVLESEWSKRGRPSEPTADSAGEKAKAGPPKPDQTNSN